MITTIFIVAALVCFLISTANPPWPRVNLIALGLAFYMLSILLGGLRA